MFGLFGSRYQWYKIFSSEEQARETIPLNKAIAVQAGNIQICLARTSRGFFAVRDKCPHQGGPLHNGYCTEENNIVCPWHQYQFNLSSGENATGIEDPVQVFPLKATKNKVSVGIPKKTKKHE